MTGHTQDISPVLIRPNTAPIPVPIESQTTGPPALDTILMSRFHTEYGPALLVPSHRNWNHYKRSRTISSFKRPEINNDWRIDRGARSAPK